MSFYEVKAPKDMKGFSLFSYNARLIDSLHLEKQALGGSKVNMVPFFITCYTRFIDSCYLEKKKKNTNDPVKWVTVRNKRMPWCVQHAII